MSFHTNYQSPKSSNNAQTTELQINHKITRQYNVYITSACSLHNMFDCRWEALEAVHVIKAAVAVHDTQDKPTKEKMIFSTVEALVDD